jgi:alkanesulfonate monooxygenase SsuD/methylene tetrahydromethanopterin reductase-like flavin-dependent oxidoreductase (luciferase family)
VAAGAYVPRNPAFRRHGAVPESEAGTFRGPFDRVARIGDGWLVAQPTPEEYGRIWRHIRRLASHRYGRPAGAIHPALVLWVNLNDDKAVARREARAMLEAYHRVGFDEETIDRYVLHGPAPDCLERLAEYAAAGARTIVLVPASVDHPGQIRRVAEQLLPHCAGGDTPIAAADTA